MVYQVGLGSVDAHEIFQGPGDPAFLVGFHFRQVDDQVSGQNRTSDQVPVIALAMFAGGFPGVVIRNAESRGPMTDFLQQALAVQYHFPVSLRIARDIVHQT